MSEQEGGSEGVSPERASECGKLMNPLSHFQTQKNSNKHKKQEIWGWWSVGGQLL